jgi:hypothetical protein
MLGYPPTLGVFKRLAHSIAHANLREVPEEAGTAHPLAIDDIKVVEPRKVAERNNFVSRAGENSDGSREIQHRGCW